jgi:Protein of unknown function (DUF2934)
MPKTRQNSSVAIKKPRTNGSHPTTEEIALRAYHIYLERGGAPGNALEDWTRAERELLEKSSKPRRRPGPKLVAA